MLVPALAMTAMNTDVVPFIAASPGDSPRSNFLKMCSITTMELETSIPTDVPNANKVIMFREKPHKCMKSKLITTVSGMVAAMMSVERIS